MKPFIISVDGNIGVGKTTLLSRLSTDYPCFPEPVEQWKFLPYFYKDSKCYGNALQLQILFSQFEQRELFPKHKDARVILVERCPETSRNVFVPLTFDPDYLPFYDRLYVHLAYKVDHFFYLQLDPETCFQRLQNRSEGNHSLSLDYLRQIENQYCKMMQTMGRDVDVIDASLPPEEVEQQVRTLLSKRFF